MPTPIFRDEMRAKAQQGAQLVDVSETEQEGTHLARSYPHGLTAREVQVLRRLAGGKTNTEIAQEL